MNYIQLEIIDLDNKARGISKDSGLIYFVENAKLGETVKVKIKKKKKSFVEAVKVETVKPSPFIKGDAYQDKELCGIYELHDLVYDKQVEFKKNSIISSINRIAGEDLQDIDFIAAKDQTGYRNKVELKVNLDGQLSFFSRSSHDNIAIERCIMNTKEINDILPKLQKLIYKHQIPGYDSKFDDGVLKNIIIRSTSLGQTMMTIVFHHSFDFKDFYMDLQTEKIVDSLYASKNSKRGSFNIAKINHVFGKEKIQEKLGDYKFNISPKSFMQVNKDISYKIYQDAKELVEKIKPDLLIDLYSGISTTSIFLSDAVQRIVSVEINQDAIEDARENASMNGISNIEWINAPAEEAINQISLEASNPAVLVDPPRAGLDQEIIYKIGQENINNVVYISCDPATLARDIKRFKEYGFELKEIRGYDQFVNTLHVEALVLMIRT